MTASKIKIKLFVFAVLIVVTLGVSFNKPISALEECAKCYTIIENGRIVGYGCVAVPGAAHRCVATVEGCDFPEGSCSGYPD